MAWWPFVAFGWPAVMLAIGAYAVAFLTAQMIRRLATLLAPIDPTAVRYLRVIRIEGAPEPPLRTAKPLQSRR